MGHLAQYHSIESSLLKYCDEILQLPSCMLIHIIKGKVKLLKSLTYSKSEETAHFYTISHIFVLYYCNFIEQNCHVLVNKLQHFITSILFVNTYNGRETYNIKTYHKFANLISKLNFIALIYPVQSTIANPVGADRPAKCQKKSSCVSTGCPAGFCLIYRVSWFWLLCFTVSADQ